MGGPRYPDSSPSDTSWLLCPSWVPYMPPGNPGSCPPWISFLLRGLPRLGDSRDPMTAPLLQGPQCQHVHGTCCALSSSPGTVPPPPHCTLTWGQIPTPLILTDVLTLPPNLQSRIASPFCPVVPFGYSSQQMGSHSRHACKDINEKGSS